MSVAPPPTAAPTSSSEEPSSLMVLTGCPLVCLRCWEDEPGRGLVLAPAWGGALPAWLALEEAEEGRSSGDRAAADWLGTPSRM